MTTIITFPIKEIEHDWREAFTALEEMSFWYKVTDTGKIEELRLTPGQFQDACRLNLSWVITLHWVIRFKWISKHKIPYKPKVREAFKPFGWLIYRYLELCIECHGYLIKEQACYSSASQWFWAIVRESQKNTIFRDTNTSKTQSLEQRRKIVNDMDCGYNPITKDKAPHEWNLNNTSLTLVKAGFDIFEDDYWKPFIQAYKKWNTSVDSSNWGATYQELDKLYVQAHRGKGQLLLDFSKI